jgi:carbamoyltransferase
MNYLGLGKTLYNSSAAVISKKFLGKEIEIQLMERLKRKKACGLWPEKAILNLRDQYGEIDQKIAENRDVIHPRVKEQMMDERFPFEVYAKKNNLEKFSTLLNPDIEFITHHMAHAWAAVLMSPFDEAVIIVIDGAGTDIKDFPYGHEELTIDPAVTIDDLEMCTIYSFQKGRLEFKRKYWQRFKESEKFQKKSFSIGVGIFYEKISEFIFNSNQAAGKVMGLAPFGKPMDVEDYWSFLERLDWDNCSWKGGSKKEWESSPHMSLYQDLAATAQKEYEKFFKEVCLEVEGISSNLILTGGCTLNCSANMKIFDWTSFEEVYVTPFPGDSSISLGCASYLFHKENSWKKFPKTEQHGYFGPTTSIPDDERVKTVFKDYELKQSSRIEKDTAELLKENNVIAWFQGRSESGPRALGNRSILARVDYPNLKEYLNEKIKFRESFRPYGCSVIYESASKYFDFNEKFETPYMSFAVPVKEDKRTFLKEVSHIDGSSRMQTVRKGQNKRYHRLLMEFGKLTGDEILLNTSLNIMGEPIVESLEDLESFFSQSEVDYVVAGNFIISKK